MSARELALVAQPSAVIPAQADSDATLIRLWLHGRPQTTAAGYADDNRGFQAFLAGTPLAHVTLGQLQDYADSLNHLAPSTCARKLSVIKSLFTFAHRLGYVPFNVGSALRVPAAPRQLAARIMAEADVHRLIALEPHPRNRTMLTLLYGAGLRAAEAAGLRWCDLHARDGAGQITVTGKGSKVRSILLPASVWTLLTGLRGEAAPDAPVFPSSRGGRCLDRSAIFRVVQAAAKRAGLPSGVSAHWLRHCHVSHALDRGAPAHLVQTTVGHSSLATTSRYAHARPNDSSARYLAL